MILEVASGANRSMVLRIKLMPCTRAKVFGLPKRVENPAASTTKRSVDRVEEFIGMISGCAKTLRGCGTDPS